MNRNIVTTLCEIGGMALVLVGLWQFSSALALVVAGSLLIGIGVRNA